MAPQPKRKISKGRRDRRRAHHALPARNLVSCSNCGSLRLPHTVCSSCGHYQGREVIQVDKNQGKGEAVRQGLLKAISLEASVTGFFDADLATPISEILRLAEVTKSCNKQVILGSRVFLLGHNIQRSHWRFLLGRAFATVASFLLKINVHDTQCGAKIIVNFKGLEACLYQPFQSSWLFDVELINRLIYVGNLTLSDFYEEPLLEWTDVAGSKIKISFFAVALKDLLKIIFSLKKRSNNRGFIRGAD